MRHPGFRRGGACVRGNRNEAIETLLEIEIKLNELRALVELASFVNRRTEGD